MGHSSPLVRKQLTCDKLIKPHDVCPWRRIWFLTGFSSSGPSWRTRARPQPRPLFVGAFTPEREGEWSRSGRAGKPPGRGEAHTGSS